MKPLAISLFFSFILILPSHATAADGPVIAFGAEREEIRATPILERQNRPLHFYGNTVRRIHARQTGSVLPRQR